MQLALRVVDIPAHAIGDVYARYDTHRRKLAQVVFGTMQTPANPVLSLYTPNISDHPAPLEAGGSQSHTSFGNRPKRTNSVVGPHPGATHEPRPSETVARTLRRKLTLFDMTPRSRKGSLDHAACPDSNLVHAPPPELEAAATRSSGKINVVPHPRASPTPPTQSPSHDRSNPTRGTSPLRNKQRTAVPPLRVCPKTELPESVETDAELRVEVAGSSLRNSLVIEENAEMTHADPPAPWASNVSPVRKRAGALTPRGDVSPSKMANLADPGAGRRVRRMTVDEADPPELASAQTQQFLFGLSINSPSKITRTASTLTGLQETASRSVDDARLLGLYYGGFVLAVVAEVMKDCFLNNEENDAVKESAGALLGAIVQFLGRNPLHADVAFLALERFIDACGHGVIALVDTLVPALMQLTRGAPETACLRAYEIVWLLCYTDFAHEQNLARIREALVLALFHRTHDYLRLPLFVEFLTQTPPVRLTAMRTILLEQREYAAKNQLHDNAFCLKAQAIDHAVFAGRAVDCLIFFRRYLEARIRMLEDVRLVGGSVLGREPEIKASLALMLFKTSRIKDDVLTKTKQIVHHFFRDNTHVVSLLAEVDALFERYMSLHNETRSAARSAIQQATACRQQCERAQAVALDFFRFLIDAIGHPDIATVRRGAPFLNAYQDEVDALHALGIENNPLLPLTPDELADLFSFFKRLTRRTNPQQTSSASTLELLDFQTALVGLETMLRTKCGETVPETPRRAQSGREASFFVATLPSVAALESDQAATMAVEQVAATASTLLRRVLAVLAHAAAAADHAKQQELVFDKRKAQIERVFGVYEWCVSSALFAAFDPPEQADFLPLLLPMVLAQEHARDRQVKALHEARDATDLDPVAAGFLAKAEVELKEFSPPTLLRALRQYKQKATAQEQQAQLQREYALAYTTFMTLCAECLEQDRALFQSYSKANEAYALLEKVARNPPVGFSRLVVYEAPRETLEEMHTLLVRKGLAANRPKTSLTSMDARFKVTDVSALIRSPLVVTSDGVGHQCVETLEGLARELQLLAQEVQGLARLAAQPTCGDELAERYHALALKYDTSPALHLLWMGKLRETHEAHGHWLEAGVCEVQAAYHVYTALQDEDVGALDTERLLRISPDFLCACGPVAELPPQCNEATMLAHAQAALTLFQRADMPWYGLEVCHALCAYHEHAASKAELGRIHGTFAELYWAAEGWAPLLGFFLVRIGDAEYVYCAQSGADEFRAEVTRVAEKTGVPLAAFEPVFPVVDGEAQTVPLPAVTPSDSFACNIVTQRAESLIELAAIKAVFHTERTLPSGVRRARVVRREDVALSPAEFLTNIINTAIERVSCALRACGSNGKTAEAEYRALRQEMVALMEQDEYCVARVVTQVARDQGQWQQDAQYGGLLLAIQRVEDSLARAYNTYQQDSPENERIQLSFRKRYARFNQLFTAFAAVDALE